MGIIIVVEVSENGGSRAASMQGYFYDKLEYVRCGYEKIVEFFGDKRKGKTKLMIEYVTL